MSKLKKKITVRFFSINASGEFFEDFISSQHASWANDKPIRFFNIREKKHLIKIHSPIEYKAQNIYFLSVVRERTTWQAKALADGSISGIHSNQGLIGDLYYYLVIPWSKSILGFTSGPSASVRTVASAVLQQFKKDRASKIVLEPISKESESIKIKELKEFTEMRFSLTPALLDEYNDDMPSIFKELKASPFMSNSSRLELTVSEFSKENYTHDDLLAAIDYLADSECCTALFIKGININGEIVHLNLNNAYLAHTTQIRLRENFIDEVTAKDIILNALSSQYLL